MAGILDPKTRIMDFIITSTGRKEIRDGKLEFHYISYSDDGVYYGTDDGQTANDAGSRIAFEACSLPRDTIIPEFDAGASISVNIPAGYNLSQNRMYTTGSKELVTGSLNLYSGSQELMRSSQQHFEWLNSIGTRNIFTVDDNFEIGLSPDSATVADTGVFYPSTGSYVRFRYATSATGIAKLNYIENVLPIIADPRFSNLRNYKELTPYVYNHAEGRAEALGLYPSIGGTHAALGHPGQVRKNIYQSLSDLGKVTDTMEILADGGQWSTAVGANEFPYAGEDGDTAGWEYSDLGVDPVFQRRSDGTCTAYVEFTSISDDNNLLMQMFSQNGSQVEKLVLVDAGEFANSDPDSPGTRFVYAGKVVRGSSGIPKFIRLFTMELS